MCSNERCGHELNNNEEILLFENKVSLFGYIYFFHSNIILNCSSHFEKSHVRESI